VSEQWTAVDDYINGALVPSDAALDGALSAADAAGLMAINVAPNQGKLLHVLARSISARRILEVGTLGGYSTIWLARALGPGGSLVTLEIDPNAAATATKSIAAAGLADVVEVRLGPALDSLTAMAAAPHELFDFVFIDANKDQNPEYFATALTMTRAGGIIVVDNVVRGGQLVDAGSQNPMIVGVRRLFETMAAEPRVVTTAVQTVGSKGWDGFAIALVVGA
jgi:predicted O-methyltransferase YrrM